MLLPPYKVLIIHVPLNQINPAFSLGFVRSYHSLLVCRFFLGLLEGRFYRWKKYFYHVANGGLGGVFPGLVLYLSCFYPRQRLNWR